jgi:putative ABC transport system permease protein
LNNDSLTMHKMETMDFDNDFQDAMGLQIIQGRGFSASFNDKEAILINEQAAKTLSLKNPIGIQTNQGHIIGVVKDFHIHSLHSVIPPMFMSNRYESAEDIVVRLKPDAQKSAVISFIKKQWMDVSGHETMDYRFADEDLKEMYSKESHLKSIISVFLFLAIFLSLLGLYGISIHMTQQRTKEMGIRKVNGATRLSIVFLLTNYISKLVFVASIIACPIAWFFMHSWLQNFAYRFGLKWWFFAFACLAALIIAIITVGGQAFRAANRNPVEALRYE